MEQDNKALIDAVKKALSDPQKIEELSKCVRLSPETISESLTALNSQPTSAQLLAQAFGEMAKRSSDYAYSKPEIATYRAGSDDGFSKAIGAIGFGALITICGYLLGRDSK